MIPDPTVDPTAALTLFHELYGSGALFCIGIVAVFMAVTALAKFWPWLTATPTRKHDVSIAIGVLGVFAIPAAQGTTPNAMMIGTALAAIVSLIMPGLPSTPPSDPTLPVAKVVKVGLVLALALLVSCATLKTMSGAWETCAKTDLGQIVDGQGKSLSAYVADLLDGNGAALESALLALAGQIGLDAVECAVTAYEQTHAGSGSAMATSLAEQSGLARAQAWIAAQRKAGE